MTDIRRIASRLAARIDAFSRKSPNSASLLTDLQFLGLFAIDGVPSALRYGDEAAAKRLVLAHYRSKVAATWLAAPGYITDMRVDTSKLSNRQLLKLADRVLDFDISPSGIRPGINNGRIRWQDTADGSREWLWMLNRHAWWIVLGRAYVISHEEKYAAAFAEQLRDWILSNPVIKQKDEASPTWRLMETALRMRLSWLPCFKLFFHAPSFDDDTKWMMLKSIYDHANFLKTYTSSKNHLLRESNGLAAVAIHFNEFVDAQMWLELAIQRITAELSTQVHKDGMQIENSTGYQWLAVDELQITFELLSHSDKQRERTQIQHSLGKMCDVLCHLSRPDGSFPQLNDGFILWDISRLQSLGKILERGEFIHVGSLGSHGKPPAELTRNLENSGIVSMRSAWSTTANFLLFDCGPYGGHHGHEDKLSIDVCCNGKPILVDSGSYTYEDDDPYRDFFVSSHSHNTVTVDGFSQLRRCNHRLTQAGIHNTENAWYLSHGNVVVASGIYDDGYGRLDMRNLPRAPEVNDVTHRRTVLFVNGQYWIVLDSLFGHAPHCYEWLYHCDPRVTAQALHDSDHILLREDMDDTVLLAFRSTNSVTGSIVSGCDEPIQGWFSRDHYRKEPASTLCISGETVKRVSAATVIVATPQSHVRDTVVRYEAGQDAITHDIRVQVAAHCDDISLTYVTNDGAGVDRRIAALEVVRNNSYGEPQVLCSWPK